MEHERAELHVPLPKLRPRACGGVKIREPAGLRKNTPCHTAARSVVTSRKAAQEGLCDSCTHPSLPVAAAASIISQQAVRTAWSTNRRVPQGLSQVDEAVHNRRPSVNFRAGHAELLCKIPQHCGGMSHGCCISTARKRVVRLPPDVWFHDQRGSSSWPHSQLHLHACHLAIASKGKP